MVQITNSTVTIASVRTEGDDVVVDFEDGHKAIFEPYSHGFGYQVEGLRRFCLDHNGVRVVEYNARLYRSGPQDDEHQLVKAAEGYTQERIAEYWGAAKRHLNTEYFEKPHAEGVEGPRELWYPWMVTSNGWMDLDMLENGTAELRAVPAESDQRGARAHLERCAERAMNYCLKGEKTSAIASFLSDVAKHKDTGFIQSTPMVLMLLEVEYERGPDKFREFMLGFNVVD